jgi:hypothetical protein
MRRATCHAVDPARSQFFHRVVGLGEQTPETSLARRSPRIRSAAGRRLHLVTTSNLSVTKDIGCVPRSCTWAVGARLINKLSNSGRLYCGVYEADEKKGAVIHVPSVALLPNLIGATLFRPVTLTGDTLTLLATSARPLSTAA